MADSHVQAQYHRHRAEQFRAKARDANVPSIRETYVRLANTEDALADLADQLTKEQQSRQTRRKQLAKRPRHKTPANPTRSPTARQDR